MGATATDQPVVLDQGRRKNQRFLRAPTILAWDLGALRRILAIEARSP
jgi:hypothetical protein